ncbi:uncharacterized protein LOC143182763 [Calliopsis andreniformis]|uniref:uncharacterized protein LOC143182763 n=1 Tax=Calliopsis andreniformis TaxID=337506 RepID=UPI003FCE5A6B
MQQMKETEEALKTTGTQKSSELLSNSEKEIKHEIILNFTMKAANVYYVHTTTNLSIPRRDSARYLQLHENKTRKNVSPNNNWQIEFSNCSFVLLFCSPGELPREFVKDHAHG